MRFVERNPASSAFFTAVEGVRNRLEKIVATAGADETIRGEIFNIRDQIIRPARVDLNEQFLWKCAYCETSLQEADQNVDWFRPMFGAQRGNGNVDQSHYSWLVAEWNNLYVCCRECNAYKKNLFPVNGKSEWGAPLSMLRRTERAFLIDPCFDQPERHFEVGAGGRLLAKSTRARATIKILNLNRGSLCERRSRILWEFRTTWNEVSRNGDLMESPQIESVAQMLDHRAPHVGVLFLYLWQIISKKHKQIVSRFIRVGVYRNGLAALLASIARLPDIDELSQSSESDGSPADENLAGISIRSRPLKSLKIVGFKGIDSIDIEFPIASESAGGALAIVGQNAAGKSTILQALGLALIGPEEANKVVKDARIFLPDGRQRSSVRVTFWGDDRSNQIDIIRESPRFGGVAELPVRVYGYGPYRLLAQRPLKKSKRGIRYRLASLFDDGERLNGYHGWLDNLSDAKRRDLAEILELLITSPGTDVRVSPANLEITTNGRPHPLHALSSGMQSVVSMCTDLAEALYATGDSALATNCVILVDELDAHLHPAWRMGIVKRLNRAFPNAQLVFSTHDPLSLRGLSADQVQILYRDANGAANAKRADRYSDALDVDQILTSEIFGLFNTHAPDWEPTFKSYYDLLAKEDSAGPLLPQERAQLDALRVELQALGVLGKTRRERLMYGVIDRLLAQQTGTIDEWDPATIKKLASDVQNKIDEQPVSGRDEGRGQ